MELVLIVLTTALFVFVGFVFYRERRITTDKPVAPVFTKTPEVPQEPVEPLLVTLEDMQKHRIALQKYKEKLKAKERLIEERERLIAERERESTSRIKQASEDLERYSKALYETEFRIIDYVKRVDKREAAVYEEIRKNAAKYEQYNSDPSKDGFMFERTVADLMKKNGFQRVSVTQQSNDYGADVTAEKDGVKYVVQCKYYQSAVGIEAVQQIYSAKVHYGSHVAVVATNSVFTHAAKVLAEETGVLLWDCEKLAAMEESK